METPFSDIIDGIIERIRQTVTTGKLKAVAVPDDDLHEYTAEDGILIRIRPPEPQTLCGAGRWGMLVQRTVDIIITTQSLGDKAGEDIVALKKHCNREEAVSNAMTHQFGSRIGIQVHWVPGGQDIARQLKRDTGMLTGGLSFRILYTSPMTV